jgi:RNA polymerase sigma factor (sigma-70 family)
MAWELLVSGANTMPPTGMFIFISPLDKPMPNSKKNFMQQLYLKHGLELRQFLIRRVGEQEAPDLLQETWLRFFQLEDIDAVRAPRAFLYKTAANIAIDFGRKTKRISTFTEEGMEDESISSTAPTQESIAEGHWQFDRFADALQDLSWSGFVTPTLTFQSTLQFQQNVTDGFANPVQQRRMG